MMGKLSAGPGWDANGFLTPKHDCRPLPHDTDGHEKKRFRFWNLDVKRIGSTDPELGPLFGLQNEISLWHSVCFFKYNIMTFNI